MSLAGWLVGNAVGQVCYRSNLAEEAKNNWMAKKKKRKERREKKKKKDRQTTAGFGMSCMYFLVREKSESTV